MKFKKKIVLYMFIFKPIAHPLWNSVEAIKHHAEFLHRLAMTMMSSANRRWVMYSPLMLMLSPCHSRSLKASSIVAVNSFREITSFLRLFSMESPSCSAPVLEPTWWRYHTNTSTLWCTDSQYGIAGVTQVPPMFPPIRWLSHSPQTLSIMESYTLRSSV